MNVIARRVIAGMIVVLLCLVPRGIKKLLEFRRIKFRSCDIAFYRNLQAVWKKLVKQCDSFVKCDGRISYNKYDYRGDDYVLDGIKKWLESCPLKPRWWDYFARYRLGVLIKRERKKNEERRRK